jgi:hypothetical protein
MELINNEKHKIISTFDGAKKPHHFIVEEYDEIFEFWDSVKKHSYIQELLDLYKLI